MIKESFTLKLNLFFFFLLLSFPLFHFWGAERMFMKPVFLCLVGVAGFIFFSKGKLVSSTILTSLVIQICIVFLFLQFYFRWNIEIIPYIFLLAFFLFYKIGVSFLEMNHYTNKNTLIISTYIVIISIEILLFALSKKNVFLKFYPNESIFSILLAAQLIFITPYFKKINGSLTKNKQWDVMFPICYVFLCYFILICTKGRAGILGFTIGLGILNYGYLKSKVGYLKGTLIAICLLLLLTNFKSNSSNGRLLVYKVITTQLEPKELITGIGYGKFKVKYNELQAKYFSKESIDSNEALLATNNYYLFNDPLQFIIETGLIGLVILSFLLIKLLILFKRNYAFLNQKPILNGAYLSIICIIVSSLFSYPFQITAIVLHFIFCISIILHEEKPADKKLRFLQKNHLIITRMTLLLGSICLLFFGQEFFKFYLKSNEAIRFSNTGFRKKAIDTYHKIADNSIQDRDILYNYADELSKVNKIDSALIILHRSSNYLNNDKSSMLIGDLLQEKQLLSEAEKQYKKAVYINPKLFTNRAALFKFYYKTQQFEKALHWGNSILKMPVKVPSKTVTDIKNETRIVMGMIKKSPKT